MLNLKLARIKKRYTQQQLADIIGEKMISISRYETGASKPPIGKLCKLADVLEVSTDYLLGREK